MNILQYSHAFDKLKATQSEEIQNDNWDPDADSVSSVNQRPCWDTGAMLFRCEAPGRVETLAPRILSPWKASPCHNTLREQVGHHPHAMMLPATSHQLLATSSKHAWENFNRPNMWEPSIMQYPSATLGIKQHPHPQKTDSPREKKNWINNRTEN
jgi:hypothetical protein